MRYALFVYDTSGSLDFLTPEERQSVYDEYVAVSEIPGVVGHRLQPPDTATTLRISNGEHVVVAGSPPDSSTQHLAGFYLLDADDREQALAVAARIPAASLGGAIQVQPLVSER
jgi:hypothetical protein